MDTQPTPLKHSTSFSYYVDPSPSSSFRSSCSRPPHPTKTEPRNINLPHEMTIDLLDILQSSLSPFNDECTRLNLSSTEVTFMKILMTNNPQTFNTISSQINELLQNKTVEISDIPNVIYIIAVVYINDISNKKIDIIRCIQITVDALLETGILPLTEDENKIVQTLIDVSFKLLQITIDKEGSAIMSFLRNKISSFTKNVNGCCHPNPTNIVTPFQSLSPPSPPSPPSPTSPTSHPPAPPVP